MSFIIPIPIRNAPGVPTLKVRPVAKRPVALAQGVTIAMMPSPDPTINANTLPLVVPIARSTAATDSGSGAGSSSGAVPTTPASSTNTPQIVGTTTSFSLGSYIGEVISSPSQHIIGIIVILLIAFWLYKHVLKGLFK